MLKQFVIKFAIISLIAVFAVAQEQTEISSKEKKECTKGCCSEQGSNGKMTMAHMDADSTHKDHHQMKSNSTDGASIVREGEIDLSAIDKNKDGKIYQDQMCWNVISDKAGKCPLCKMTLKEVTLEDAKVNLMDSGFKVK